jgi:uncharacterized protein (TIGR02145 family)
MAENLNYKIANSWCYNNDEANGKKFGRLYTWKSAKKACPAKWHLPTREEWRELVRAVDPNAQLSNNDLDDANVTGTMLKLQKKPAPRDGTCRHRKNGVCWRRPGHNVLSGIDNKDTFGFSALPGGYRGSNGCFYNARYVGYWWTATVYGGRKAYFRGMDYCYGNVSEYIIDVSVGFSVRCLKN